MDITHYIWPQGILFASAVNKQQALEQLITLACRHPTVTNPKALSDGIFSREKIISTGIGLGVAIPHAKIKGIDDFFVCISILKQGVDWEAIDDVPVRIIFLIAGPESQQNQYLQLLARLSLTVKNQTKREAILNAHAAAELIQAFSGN